jgi:hypothetical protein
VQCQVVAPPLTPVKPGDRIKTDRRDARKLARSHRAGDLTAVWVRDAAHAALRGVGKLVAEDAVAEIGSFGRELIGLLWSIAVRVESRQTEVRRAA